MDLGSKGNWQLYWDGGLFGGLLMTADASASGSSQVYLDKEQTQPVGSVVVKFDSTGNIKNQLHKGNFGIEGNVGFALPFGQYGHFCGSRWKLWIY